MYYRYREEENTDGTRILLENTAEKAENKKRINEDFLGWEYGLAVKILLRMPASHTKAPKFESWLHS